MLGLNILFSRAVQKEVHLEHIVEKIFPSLFRKKILFLFDFGKRFLFGKRMLFTILLFLRIIFRDIVKLYLKIFILISLRKRKKLFYKQDFRDFPYLWAKRFEIFYGIFSADFFSPKDYFDQENIMGNF